MGFKANPDDIKSFAALVQRAADDNQEAVSFLNNKANAEALEVSGGMAGELFLEAYSLHGERVEDAKRILSRIEKILTASSRELAKSADYYRATDRKQAAAVDSTYPESKRGTPEGTEWDVPDERGSFKDVHDARGELTPPDKEVGHFSPDIGAKAKSWAEGHADEWEFNPAVKGSSVIMDLISPSALVTEGLKLAFNFDPFAEVSGKITGDWEGLQNYAKVWDDLRKFCLAVAANLSSGSNSTRYSWEGNAADASQVYFEEFCALLDTTGETFASLRDNYEQLAVSAWALQDSVKSGLMFLSDLALEAMIIAAASSAAATSGVGVLGTLAGYALVAKRVLDMIEQYKVIIKAFDTFQYVMKGIYGAAAGAGAEMDFKVKKFPTPGKGYDNAVV